MVDIQPFATPENMNIFWGNIKALLIWVNPWVMISFAMVAVGLTIKLVVNVFRKGSRDKDDDFEYDEY